MGPASSFRISGRLDEIDRTDKWTTIGDTPNAVTLRNCEYTPYVEINIWSHPSARLLNDETKSVVIAADADMRFKPLKYGTIAT